MKTKTKIINKEVIGSMGYTNYRGYIDSTKGIDALKSQFTFFLYHQN